MLIFILHMFERYVNFEFYKTVDAPSIRVTLFERYVNFEFYKTYDAETLKQCLFERYVNFEFYKTYVPMINLLKRLRDM